MHRRQLLAILGIGGLSFAAYRAIGGSGMTARGIKWPRGLTPAVTPPGDHYRVSKNFLFDPRTDSSAWRLDIHGLVLRPVSLSLDGLRAMPAVEEYATLACIGNSVPARAISTALWRGVPLAAVLERAGGASALTGDVVFTAADNYTDSIPLDRALRSGTLLAYEMNGRPLPPEHGAPLRAIVPGIYGMKNVKWIEAIEVVGGDYRGYWQQRGWSDSAPYRTVSRIDEPRRGGTLASGASHQICGIAFGGDRGISSVELSIERGNGGDDGAGFALTERTGQLQPPLGPYSWVLWTCEWRPSKPGPYTITARAVDAAGAAQIADEYPNFPDGATGLHKVEINVR